MYKVYMYRNSFNGMVYIGSTRLSLNQRLSNGYKGRFKEALDDYGIESFTRTILCLCETKEEAQLKEQKFIDLYDATNPKCGYNMLRAGGHKRRQSVKCVEQDLTFNSLADAERFFGGGHKLYRVINNPNRTYHGYHWVSIDE